MNKSYKIRQARKEEALELAILVNQAGAGPETRGLDLAGWSKDAANGQDPFEYGAGIIEAEEGYYSYHNMRVIEVEGKVAALSMSFVVKKRTAEEMEKIPEDFRVFKKLTNTIVGCFYLDSLAVSADYRGCGFGRKMLDDTMEAAKEKGFDAIYLLVFDENKTAVKLYEKNEFHALRGLPVPINPDMPYCGNVVLYKKDL